MSFSPLQNEVIQEARKRLEGKPWFKGICTDDLPMDREIEEDREGCIHRVMDQTTYWDAPMMGLGA